MLQSSHSRTGFHPSRFAQTSHFALRRVLEKNISSGLQSASVERVGDWLRLCAPCVSRPLEPRFEPGLIKVNRCTIGMVVDPRIVEPPSVALARDMILDEDAVWYDSIESSDSEAVVVVGVGPWAPVASGRFAKSSEPFGFGDGRIVMIDDSDGGTVSV